MIVLFDSSVFLRRLLNEPDPLVEWRKIQDGYVSRLLPIEVGRAFNRLRLLGKIGDEDVVALQQDLAQLLRSVGMVGFSEPILSRAAGPLPIPLGTLDAIHLATAIELATELKSAVAMATHDTRLAAGSRASGLTVLGA